MNISIEQIRCLNEIRNTGSITKAGEKLLRAKSAVNYSIKTLEEQLGFKVLDKSGYRPSLTPQGQEFLFKSKTLLKEYDALIESAQQILTGVEMSLTISASGICNLDALYQVIKDAMEAYPSTEITLHREILSGEKMLEEDMVDMALFESLNNNMGFDYKQVDRLKLPLVISGDHPFLEYSKEQQTLEELGKYPQIIQRSSLENFDIKRGVVADALKWSVSDTHSKCDIIKKGMGWGRLPDHMIFNELKDQSLVHLRHLDRGYENDVKVYLCRKKLKNPGMVNEFIWNLF